MLSNINECFYDVDFSAEELERIVKFSDDDQLTALTPRLISKWENTYSFTKAIAEKLVSAYYPYIPVAVARPSIITPTVSEPLAGWIDNMYGTTGVSIGCSFGILKVWRCDPQAINDMIPVDVVVNSILSIGWYISSNKPQPVDNIMFNLVSCKKKPLPTEKYMKIIKKIYLEDRTFPSLIMGTINLSLVKNEMLFWFYILFFHLIPGLLFDVGLRIFGQSPILMRIYRKAYKTNNSFASYITKEFNFSDTNVDKLWNLMNPMDRKLFNFDQDSYTYTEYYRHAIRGVRVYLLKDPMETVPQARRRYKIILYLNNIFKMALYAAVGWFIAYTFLQWFSTNGLE
uniref:Fatty acyl-CoA reductase n=2 Tax=Clastoptera arizonana TaxID=38151 RepID=A0A1B6DRB1_9HEMI